MRLSRLPSCVNAIIADAVDLPVILGTALTSPPGGSASVEAVRVGEGQEGGGAGAWAAATRPAVAVQ